MAARSVVGLVGPNGAGKSTLLKILALLIPPTRGRILVDGREAADPAGWRGRITMLLQEPYLLQRSVFDNVAYGLRIAGQSDGVRDRVDRALEAVGLDPAGFARRSWRELSGGEARRVALAARLALRPLALLLDEPTAGVDAPSAELIKKAALEARDAWGTTLLVASHDIDWLNGTADALVHLAAGRLTPAGEGGRTGL